MSTASSANVSTHPGATPAYLLIPTEAMAVNHAPVIKLASVIGTANHPLVRVSVVTISNHGAKDQAADVHQATDTELVRIQRFYTFHKGSTVRAFLDRHPLLIPVLLEALGQITSRFGSVQVTLEVVTDYDATSADDNQCLVAYIAAALEPSQALEKLNDLYTDWWFQVHSEAHHWLAFDVEGI